MSTIHIDFESRSTVDIWDAGAWIYSTHPNTQILCLAYAVDDQPVQILTMWDLIFPGEKVKALCALAKDPGNIFVAHNAFFEQCIWQNKLVQQCGYPMIPTHRWRCTVAKACALGLPKALGKCAEALGLAQGKDNAGRQIMLKMCKPRAPRKNEDPNKLYWYDSNEDFAALYKYCIQDVEVEREIDRRLPELISAEQEVWQIDQMINARGVQTDQAFICRAIGLLDEHIAKLNAELKHITGGTVSKGTEVAGMLRFLKSKGVDLPDLTKDTVRNAILDGLLPKNLTRVLRLRQELGKASVAKFTRMIDAADKQGIIRDNFIYHSATTGRWGGKLVQMQNLPRGAGAKTESVISNVMRYDYNTLCMIYPGKLLDTLSSCLRGCFVARPGKTLLIVDYAAIEARVVMWLAGEQQGLTDFELNDAGKDVDIYVKMARRIYDNPGLTKQDKKERQLGKQAILGAGYGMSGKKFCITCAGYGMNISEYEGERIIALYRQTYSAVRNLWYAMERAAIQAVNTPDTYIELGKCRWFFSSSWDWLFMILPSGRYLGYANPRLGQGKFGVSLSYMTEVNSHWVRRDTYGGHLTENCFTRNTKIVTMGGPKNIVDITPKDKIWDGQKFVQCGGCLSRGQKEVILWYGVYVTPDHLITDGLSWRSVIHSDEQFMRASLKWAQDSAPWWLRSRVQASAQKVFAYATAVKCTPWRQENCTEEKCVAICAGKDAQGRKEKRMYTEGLFKTKPYYMYGHIGIPALYLGVITRRLNRSKTMGSGASKCPMHGRRIKSLFSSMLLRLRAGITRTLCLTVLTMTKDIFPGIYGWFRAKKTATTEDRHGTFSPGGSAYREQNSCENTARNGNHIIHSCTTSDEVRPGTRLQTGIAKNTEVFDLINCGPDNRFAILTNRGMVIVHNCSQAVARDVMAYSMPELERRGFEIIMHAHDEIVAEVPSDQAHRLREMETIMCQPAKWSAGLPLKAEGFVTGRYRKE